MLHEQAPRHVGKQLQETKFVAAKAELLGGWHQFGGLVSAGGKRFMSFLCGVLLCG